MFDHLSFQDLAVCVFGIIMFWFFRFSSDKDQFDKKEDKSFSSRTWVREWIWYKWDNIACHMLASLLFLYLGEENLESWLGDLATQIPQSANEIGSAAVIGFFGSFIAEALKKLINIIKT